MTDEPLNIPGSTYQPFATTFFTDAIGQQWVTSMSDVRLRPKIFGTHLWYRRNATSPWQFVFALEDCHGWLSVNRNQLQFIYNRPKFGGTFRRVIQGYRP